VCRSVFVSTISTFGRLTDFSDKMVSTFFHWETS